MAKRIDDPRERSSGGYGYPSRHAYGYGAYGSPYGYPGYGAQAASDSALERTFQDYVLVIRERIWYIIVSLVLVLGITAVITYTRLPLYQAAATVQIFRHTPTVMQMQQVVDSQITSAEDLNTQVSILKSEAIVEVVASQMPPALRTKFLAPYAKPGQPAPTALGILGKNRDIVPERLSLIVAILYRHPDPQVAAAVANLFADAYIDYNAKIRVDEGMQAVEELQHRAEDQRKKVDQIAAAIQAYREKNKLVSLDQRHDIVTETLKELNTLVTQTSASLQGAEIRWRAVEDAQHKHANLLTLPFIASVPAVAQLQAQVATQKIAVAQLGERYRAKHPVMMQAQRSLQQAEQELDRALQTSVAQVQSDYQSALQNFTKAQAARSAQETQSLSLDRYGLEYSNLERDYEVNEKILEQILDLERMRQTASNGVIENENARLVDRATPPSKLFFPNYLLNISLGTAAGMVVGLAVAFFVAYLDDRIKSAFDIETVLGLPLLGVIPEVKELERRGRENETDLIKANREVAEAFSTLMSALQLKEDSKRAQCLLVTSTIAGEGKSFIATHLAETYAAHGEKVVIVDCDLRRPAVNRVFHLENLKGVIDVCSGGVSLDDVIVRELRPNLDVILTGGRSKNPTQTLSSKEFALMISDLRKRYTKIFIDTPPIAIVSDAFVVLPSTDGSLYSIFFNKVRRKAAKFSVQRLLDANVPCFGGVLNGLAGGIGGYYYAHYYDRSYKDYYVKRSELEEGTGAKIVEKTTQRRTR